MAHRSIYIEAAFAELVRNRLRQSLISHDPQLVATLIDGLVRSSRSQFVMGILYNFDDDGRNWRLDVDLPAEFPATASRELWLSNDEVLSCFQPTVRRIKKVLLAAILKAVSSELPVMVGCSSVHDAMRIPKLLVLSIVRTTANRGSYCSTGAGRGGGPPGAGG